MLHTTVIGVDLAKDAIQVCVVARQQVLSNKEMTPSQFATWLVKTKPSTVVFEACSTSNYWKQKAESLGHDARLISPRLVSAVRQSHKTDKNDALAIVHAAMLPNVKFVHAKTPEQQQLQTVLRLREQTIKQKTAMNNQLLGLLLEFNIRPSPRMGGLKSAVASALEDADNTFTAPLRDALHSAWLLYQAVIRTIEHYDDALTALVERIPECKKLMRLEGVGIINAINLYSAIDLADDHIFKSGKDVAACIGLTPVQHSSGGKTKLGAINKHVRKSTLRSQLVTGAFTYINNVCRRTPRTEKDAWIQALVARRGKKCAAVALANKTVRTAYSILTKGTDYRVKALVA
ncbi:IS110 family transposase [Agarivorans sp. OAG1]|uniref:IS110 family transposase n=1 Tax=Agarivorans sp. OAG1 TaxID=3082387 RepID=UPI002B320625|nr:IS110 family transposase [Agarivorans sp. OAG1]